MHIATVGNLPVTIGWLIALILAILGLVGVLPNTPLVIFGLIGALGIARVT